LLRALPGITAKNYKHVMQDVDNFAELSNMSEAELTKLTGKEAAKKVHRFFNRTS
jgi:DNA excision repair protein ERCC-4